MGKSRWPWQDINIGLFEPVWRSTAKVALRVAENIEEYEFPLRHKRNAGLDAASDEHQLTPIFNSTDVITWVGAHAFQKGNEYHDVPCIFV